MTHLPRARKQIDWTIPYILGQATSKQSSGVLLLIQVLGTPLLKASEFAFDWFVPIL